MAWTSPRPLAAALLAPALALALASGVHAQPRRGADGGACAPVSRPGLLAESPPGRIVFDDGAERVLLAPACGASLAERVRAAGERRFILLVDDLRARRGSATVFTLRLAEPDGAKIVGEDGVLGTLNFFAARPPEAPGAQRRMSYDVTRSLRALAEAGRLDHGLVVMLAPSQPPAPGAELSIARLQLVAQ